jgi:hypothetical protein
MVKLGVTTDDAMTPEAINTVTWFDKRDDFCRCIDMSTQRSQLAAPRAYDHPRTTYMGGPFIPGMVAFELLGLFCGGAVMMRLPPSWK